MFGLFFSPLRAMWSPLETVLKAKLAGKSLQLVSRFKGLLDTTTSDLAETVCQSFSATGIPSRWSNDEILTAKDKKVQISFHSFPVEWLSSSAVLAAPLQKRLEENVELGAARTTLGVTDAEWKQLLQAYTSEVVRVGVPYALDLMCKHESKFYAGETVLAIAKGEAYRINGIDGYHDLVKTYDPPSTGGGKPALGKARGIWNDRHTSKYVYEKGSIP